MVVNFQGHDKKETSQIKSVDSQTEKYVDLSHDAPWYLVNGL